VELLEEDNLPILRALLYARVLGAAQAIEIIIATYRLLACANNVEQEIYYFASNIPSKGARIGFHYTGKTPYCLAHCEFVFLRAGPSHTPMRAIHQWESPIDQCTSH